jgi:hypothetical protein
MLANRRVVDERSMAELVYRVLKNERAGFYRDEVQKVSTGCNATERFQKLSCSN